MATIQRRKKPPTRLLFVCSQGHIFRSLRLMKNGRIRQCTVCDSIVTTPGYSGMADARAELKRKKLPSAGIQVFVKGRIERRASDDKKQPRLF